VIVTTNGTAPCAPLSGATDRTALTGGHDRGDFAAGHHLHLAPSEIGGRLHGHVRRGVRLILHGHRVDLDQAVEAEGGGGDAVLKVRIGSDDLNVERLPLRAHVGRDAGER
jgi:hypothetical protein